MSAGDQDYSVGAGCMTPEESLFKQGQVVKRAREIGVLSPGDYRKLQNTSWEAYEKQKVEELKQFAEMVINMGNCHTSSCCCRIFKQIPLMRICSSINPILTGVELKIYLV